MKTLDEIRSEMRESFEFLNTPEMKSQISAADMDGLLEIKVLVDALDAAEQKGEATLVDNGRLKATVKRLLVAGCSESELPDWLKNHEWKSAFDSAVALLHELEKGEATNG